MDKHHDFVIDGHRIQDIASFYDEINRVFMQGEDWKIGNSLDAFNDLLYGGFGALKDVDKPHLIWVAAEKSKEALGYAATEHYYLEKLKLGPTYNIALFKEKLEELRRGNGLTYFEIIVDIIGEHPKLVLELK